MPSIRHLWIVRNPGPNSTLADIIWRQDVYTLDNYVIGVGFAWQAEMHSVYLSEDEATADAEARLRAVTAGMTLVRRSDGRVVGVTVPGKDRDGGG